MSNEEQPQQEQPPEQEKKEGQSLTAIALEMKRAEIARQASQISRRQRAQARRQRIMLPHKLEQQRLERQRLEQQRLERERLEQQRLEQQRLQQQRLQQQRLEKQRQQVRQAQESILESLQGSDQKPIPQMFTPKPKPSPQRQEQKQFDEWTEQQIPMRRRQIPQRPEQSKFQFYSSYQNFEDDDEQFTSFHPKKKTQQNVRKYGYRLDITRVGLVQLFTMIEVDNIVQVSNNLEELSQVSDRFKVVDQTRVKRYFDDQLQAVQLTRQSLKEIWRNQLSAPDVGFITDTFVEQATTFLRQFRPMQTSVYLPFVQQNTLVTDQTLRKLQTTLIWPEDPRRGFTREVVVNKLFTSDGKGRIKINISQTQHTWVGLTQNQLNMAEHIIQKIRQSDDRDTMFFDKVGDIEHIFGLRNVINNEQKMSSELASQLKQRASAIAQALGQMVTNKVLSNNSNKQYIAKRILAMRIDTTRRCIGWNSLSGLFNTKFGIQDLDFRSPDGQEINDDFRTRGTMMDLSPQSVQFRDQNKLSSLFRRRTLRLSVAFIIRDLYRGLPDIDVYQIHDKNTNHQLGVIGPITVYWLAQLFCQIIGQMTANLQITDLHDLTVIRLLSRVLGIPTGFFALKQNRFDDTIQLGHITMTMMDGQGQQKYLYQMINGFIRTILQRLLPYMLSITSKFFKIPQAVGGDGFFNIQQSQGLFIVTELPSNMGNINRTQNNGNSIIPNVTRSTAINAFQGWTQRQTSKLRTPLANVVGQIDRRLRFSTHHFKSQTSSVKILSLFMTQRIQSEISEVLKIRGLHAKYIQSFVIFVSIQFVKYQYEGPHSGFRAAYRTGSFQIVLSEIEQATGALQAEGYNYYPQSISLLDSRTVYNSQEVRKRAKKFQKSMVVRSMRGMRSGNFINSELVSSITQLVTQNTLLEIANYAFTASGPLFDEQYNEARNFQRQDLEQTISIQGVTVFSMPMFTASTIPMAVADKRFRSPTNNQSTSSHQHILKQNKSHEAGLRQSFYESHYRYGGNYGGSIEQMPCLTSVALQIIIWQVLNAGGSILNVRDDVLQYMNQRVFTISIHERTDDKLQSLSYWCMLIREVLNHYKIKVPIFIFIIEGVQLLQYDTASSQSQVLLQALRDQKMPLQFPVIAVQCCFSQQAHAFTTNIGCVRQFIRAAAAGSVRTMKYNTKSHTGFELYQKNPKKAGLPWKIVNNTPRSQILSDIMSNVWTLDIETLSAQGVQMQPYCICIYSVMSQKTIFGADCRRQFRSFLSMLQTTRNHQSQQITILAHNGAQFDWVILLRDILAIFPGLQLFGTTTDIKMISITQINMRFCDFFLLMSDSLQKIADNFNSPVKKVQNQDIKNLKSVEDLSNEQIENIQKYCMNDTVCLWQCVKLFAKQVIEIADLKTLAQLDFVLPPTSSQLAVNIFSHNFLKESLRGTVDQRVDDIQTKAYFGGVTQVFNFATQYDIKYVDVNSLYPSAMRNIKVQSNPASYMDINKNFRFKYVDMLGVTGQELKQYNIYHVQYFQWKQNVIGMFPVRTKQGGLCYPLRHFPQPPDHQQYWLTGVQILAAIQSEMLQTIVIDQALQYKNVSESVFQQYINTIYQRRRTASGVKQQLYKLLLNQLYGKFAQRKFETRILVRSEHIANDMQLPTRIVTQNINAAILHDIMTGNGDTHNLFAIYQNKNMKNSLIPQLSAINRIDSKMQWLQLVIQKNNTDLQSIGYLKRVSLMTTGYARAIMTRAIGAVYRQLPDYMSITKHIYYMDTDSFFMSKTAYKIMQSMALIDQSELGKFKDQFPDTQIQQAKFFAAKIYYLIDGSNKFMTQFKGVQKSVFQKMSVQQKRKLFQNLLDQQQIHKVQMQRWQRNFSQIVISDILKTTIAQPRRLANSDGTSVQFKTVWQFQQHNKQQRLVYNRDNGEFEFIDIK